MTGLVANATLLLSGAENRIEIAAQNLANIATIGYKRQLPFSKTFPAGGAQSSAAPSSTTLDFASGQAIETGAPFDIMLSGDAFFVARGTEGWLYTRAGAFRRDSAGRVVTADGFPLQMIGSDIVLSSDAIRVERDGAIIDGDRPIGRLRTVRFDDLSVLSARGAGLFAAPDGAAIDVDDLEVRQGALESSNVSSASEMIEMMSALRGAETGQRLLQVYDDLLGRAFNTLGQN